MIVGVGVACGLCGSGVLCLGRTVEPRWAIISEMPQRCVSALSMCNRVVAVSVNVCLGACCKRECLGKRGSHGCRDNRWNVLLQCVPSITFEDPGVTLRDL